MQKSTYGKLFSASDLVNFAACSHLTHLDLTNLETPLPKAADSAEMVLIQDKGFEHEERYLKLLQSQHGHVVDLKQEGISDTAAFANTAPILGGRHELLRGLERGQRCQQRFERRCALEITRQGQRVHLSTR